MRWQQDMHRHRSGGGGKGDNTILEFFYISTACWNGNQPGFPECISKATRLALFPAGCPVSARSHAHVLLLQYEQHTTYQYRTYCPIVRAVMGSQDGSGGEDCPFCQIANNQTDTAILLSVSSVQPPFHSLTELPRQEFPDLSLCV